MKKRNIIIPAILIALAVLIIPFVTMFTTVAAYDIAEAQYNGIETAQVDVFAQSYKPIEIACRLSPNRTNFATRGFLFGNFFSVPVEDLEKVCPDYKQKSVSCSLEYADYLRTHDYYIRDFDVRNARCGDAKEEDLAYAMSVYIANEYRYGDKEKAVKACEDYIRSLSAERLAASEWPLMSLRGDVAESGNADYTERIEKLSAYVINTHNANLDKIAPVFNDTSSRVVRLFNQAKWTGFGDDGYILSERTEEF